MNEPTALVQRLWSYCNILRDDGLSYGDYLEQLTYLLFLKMADEQTKLLGTDAFIPAELDWASLLARDGEDLEVHYRHILTELGHRSGMLGIVFRKAQNRIQDPAKLRRLIVDLIDRETWITLDVDVKGEAYEGLLERNAEDVKSGAGQYFTPRSLIHAIVQVMRPAPDMTICDPACGTGGFLLASHEWIAGHYPHMDPDQKRHLRFDALHGWEIVDNTARLCVMNLLLHGIGSEQSNSPIRVDDALKADPGVRFDMVLTNPPFGRKSSMMFVNGVGESDREQMVVVRDDFWASTSNKQLNFVQHVKSLLKMDGRAAVVVPDNVLFEGGAGETVRRKLLAECDVHTLLRLPTGIFYRPGVKANVLFFERKPAAEKPWTRELWVYDLRTNLHFTLKQNPLRLEHLEEFIEAYKPTHRHQRSESDRFRRFSYESLVERDKVNLDLLWLQDESLDDISALPPPLTIAEEILEDLEAALTDFSIMAASLREVRASTDTPPPKLMPSEAKIDPPGEHKPEWAGTTATSRRVRRVTSERHPSALDATTPQRDSAPFTANVRRVARRDLIECLGEAERPITPEDLMSLAGFDSEAVSEFYDELAAAVASGAVREIRGDDSTILLESAR